MVVFWLVAASMLVLALAFVLVPLLRARAVSGPSPVEANLEVLRSQRREIEADVANGTLPSEAREEALAELVGRAQDDLAPAAAPVAEAKRPWAAIVGSALLVPAIVLATYLAVGNPAAIDAPPPAAANAAMDEKHVVEMVESLARKVRERPEDAQGWALLARSMAALGRFKESAEAYEHLNKLAPGDAQVLADYADALGMAQGRSLAGKPAQLVREALKADPRNHKALALAGTVALDEGDFATAAKHWQALAAQLPPGSPEAQQVAAVLDEVRGRAAAAGKALPGSAPKATAPASAAAGKTVTGSVSLDPSVAGKVAGTETLFIFARAEGGPRVPLAVVRATARELPMKFALDDSQAMAPGMNLSSAQAVRIEARISKSGDATARAGDLVGTSAVVKPGAKDVKIVVDKVLP